MTTSLADLRKQIRTLALEDETAVVARLIAEAETHLDAQRRGRILTRARALVRRCREQADAAGTLDAFLQQFGLSNPEGVALMCLAEALLRVPDDDTADRLISEKIRAGDWASHLGQSESVFVNGSVWGLMLTGRLVTLDPETEQDTGAWMRRLVSRIGEPVVRTAVIQAMRILGRQYVLGRSIDEALKRGRDHGNALHSFDMLGEGARTWADARRHFDAYRSAIEAIGSRGSGTDPMSNDGISVKLSALHPRFEFAQRDQVLERLLPDLLELAGAARDRNLGFSIDAEEAGRLELTLDLFELLARESSWRAGAGWALSCRPIRNADRW